MAGGHPSSVAAEHSGRVCFVVLMGGRLGGLGNDGEASASLGGPARWADAPGPVIGPPSVCGDEIPHAHERPEPIGGWRQHAEGRSVATVDPRPIFAAFEAVVAAPLTFKGP